jgi:hypothetical protein
MSYVRTVPASAGSIKAGWLVPAGLLLLGMLQGHRVWMSRGYAIGLGAATQMLTLMVAGIVAGPPNELTHDSLMALSWVINLAVAEWAVVERSSG